MWRKLTIEDMDTLEKFYEKNHKVFLDSMKEGVEKGRGIGTFKNNELIAPIIILENICSDGNKIGRVMNGVPKEEKVEWEYFCKWIRENSKEYKFMVLYKFPNEEEENFKTYGIELEDILVDYKLSLEIFKPYDINCEIEEMNVKDIDDIYDVDSSAFSEIWHEAKGMVADRIRNKGEGMNQIVIKENEEIVAVGFSRIREEGLGYINRLAVKPSKQGKGYGKLLVRNALNYLYENGANRVELNTQIKNKQSRPLYESHGFVGGEEYYVYKIEKKDDFNKTIML
ncbi:MAG: GNAT family N-acetyltransferase [Clostridium sp.]